MGACDTRATVGDTTQVQWEGIMGSRTGGKGCDALGILLGKYPIHDELKGVLGYSVADLLFGVALFHLPLSLACRFEEQL